MIFDFVGDTGGVESMMPVLIVVSGNNFALVDKEDYQSVAGFSWYFSHGYARRNLSNLECEKRGVPVKTSVSMHAEIINSRENLDVDHKNNNGLDNRRSNLRQATTSQNTAWARKRFMARSDRVTTSKFKGVSWRPDRERWQAYCGTAKNRAHLGCYATEEEAAIAYNVEASQRYGKFARLNEVCASEIKHSHGGEAIL